MRKGLKKKRFRSAEEWQRILDRFELSGLTRAAFCRREGIAGSSFQKWRRKLGGDSADSRASFVEVLPPEPVVRGEIELELPRGITLRIRS